MLFLKLNTFIYCTLMSICSTNVYIKPKTNIYICYEANRLFTKLEYTA